MLQTYTQSNIKIWQPYTGAVDMRNWTPKHPLKDVLHCGSQMRTATGAQLWKMINIVITNYNKNIAYFIYLTLENIPNRIFVLLWRHECNVQYMLYYQEI